MENRASHTQGMKKANQILTTKYANDANPESKKRKISRYGIKIKIRITIGIARNGRLIDRGPENRQHGNKPCFTRVLLSFSAGNTAATGGNMLLLKTAKNP
jgi:hypothetical protein